jgi:hypothetical protein
LIGKLQRVPLREVWKHEARDFTAWLQENLDVLNDVVDFNLVSAEREKSTGNFNVDLVAEDDGGGTVIIENQLEKSDHDHLGKVITYLAAFEAKRAIWIVSNPRAEHVGAMTWLNESSSASFYLVKAEAIKIGDSPPAPLLTLIVGPGEGRSEIRETKEDLTEGKTLRKNFWTGLLMASKGKTNLFSGVSPSEDNWIGKGAGVAGLSYNYVVRRNSASVELYFNRGTEKDNKGLFDRLSKSKDEIEKAFGGSLDWQRMDEKVTCRVKKAVEMGGYKDQEKWPTVFEAMIDAMIGLEKAAKPFVAKLGV